MKKTMFAFAAAGMMLASCGSVGNDLVNALLNPTSETMMTGVDGSSTQSSLTSAGVSILSQLLTNLTSGGSAQKGTQKTYTGTITAQLLAYNKTSKTYSNSGKQTTTSNATTTLTVGSSTTGLTIPKVTANNAVMSQVTLTNLVASNGKYGLGDNSTCTEGKLTVGGTSYDLANAYVELTYNDTKCEYSASIYFNYDEAAQAYMYAMNVTFK